jgi:hypothetical protein
MPLVGLLGGDRAHLELRIGIGKQLFAECCVETRLLLLVARLCAPFGAREARILVFNLLVACRISRLLLPLERLARLLLGQVERRLGILKLLGQRGGLLVALGREVLRLFGLAGVVAVDLGIERLLQAGKIGLKLCLARLRLLGIGVLELGQLGRARGLLR